MALAVVELSPWELIINGSAIEVAIYPTKKIAKTALLSGCLNHSFDARCTRLRWLFLESLNWGSLRILGLRNIGGIVENWGEDGRAGSPHPGPVPSAPQWEREEERPPPSATPQSADTSPGGPGEEIREEEDMQGAKTPATCEQG